MNCHVDSTGKGAVRRPQTAVLYHRRPPEGTAAAPKAWLLEVAMGICVAMIAISGLLGSPEGVVCFTGIMMIVTFMHYHF